MKKRICVPICLSVVLSAFLYAHENKVIPPTTTFLSDLKYKDYFEFMGIQISNYYEIGKIIALNINNDEKKDFLVLLVPKSIIPPLSDDFNFEYNKFYKRTIVEIISVEGSYVLANSYVNLVSNIAGLLTGFDDINVIDNNIEIVHSKSNGNIYWEIRMYYHYILGKLYFYRIDFINNDNEISTSEFENVAAENINISDFLCNE